SLVLEANSDVSLGGTGSNAIVTVDDSEKSVGINNNAPETVFHVLTDSPNVGMFESSGTEGWFLLDNSGSADYNSVAVGSVNDDLRLRAGDAEQVRIDSNGNVGFGVFSGLTHPIQAASGAHLTTGGAWTNSSSRELKENIVNLTTIEAFDTLSGLSPVKYNYKNEKDEPCVGFIAEDVPEMVAQKDRKSLSPMDVVGVLTKVVQEQQKTIKELNERLERLERKSK
ncbi:MAG: tail fiber domain-containing protein, partial [bacterium]|nr:tail fiber domain-containing protein [bacterium]